MFDTSVNRSCFEAGQLYNNLCFIVIWSTASCLAHHWLKIYIVVPVVADMCPYEVAANWSRVEPEYPHPAAILAKDSKYLGP